MAYSGVISSSCSHNLTTVQPSFCRRLVVFLSLALFVRNFFSQNDLFCFGALRHLHPCQKHPSTKTATRNRGKTKSGRPGRTTPRLHPEMPAARISVRSRSSVLSLPLLLLLCMMRVRKASGFCTTGERFCTSVLRLVGLVTL